MPLYEPLVLPDTVRLLHLNPGPSNLALTGTLATTSLTNPIAKYLALSYTWGSPTTSFITSTKSTDIEKFKIILGDHTLEITSNLRDALLNIRDEKDVIILWIDAICINQGNKDEIERQLPLIPRIYSEAVLVIVWLGVGSPTFEQSIALAGTCCEKYGIHLMAEPMACVGQSESGSAHNLSLTTAERRAIKQVLHRAWFSRVWTFQEICVAKQAVAWHGSKKVQIQDLALLATLMLQDESSQPALGLANATKCQDRKRNLCHAAALSAAYASCLWPGGGFGSRALLRYLIIDYEGKIKPSTKWLTALELFVHEMRARECTCLGDKVIAPLVFSLHEKFAPPDLPEHYQKRIELIIRMKHNPRSTYREFTWFLVEAMDNLDVLSRIDHNTDGTESEVLGLPSWVPDYSRPGTSSLIDNLLMTKFDACRFLRRPKSTQASRRISVNELEVHAIPIGQISRISSFWAECDVVSLWLSLVCGDQDHKLQANVDKPTRHDMDHAQMTVVQTDDFAMNVYRRIKPVIAYAKHIDEKKAEYFNCTVRNLLSAISIMELATKTCLRRKRRLAGIISQERHIKTIGLVPLISKEGDWVCLLHGAKVPFVLRRHEHQSNHFTVVGEAYVEHFMGGEAQMVDSLISSIILV